MTPEQLVAMLAHLESITIADLARWADCPRRDVEAAVQQARLEGHPILTDGNGVALATSAAQMTKQYRRLRARYVSQAQTARAVLRTAHRMEREEAARATPPAVLFPDMETAA